MNRFAKFIQEDLPYHETRDKTLVKKLLLHLEIDPKVQEIEVDEFFVKQFYPAISRCFLVFAKNTPVKFVQWVFDKTIEDL